jgi:hypothetical protein
MNAFGSGLGPESIALDQALFAAASLILGRIGLSLLPPGAPGSGSWRQWPGVLAATIVLGSICAQISWLAAWWLLGGDATSENFLLPYFWFASASGAALLLVRRWLGPAAMRPRRDPQTSRPTTARGRALASVAVASCAAILAVAFVGLGSDEPVGRRVHEPVPLDSIALVTAGGAAAFLGLCRGWTAGARWSLAALAMAALHFSAEPLLGPSLGGVGASAPFDPATSVKFLGASAIAQACFLLVYRQRAERRCLWLACACPSAVAGAPWAWHAVAFGLTLLALPRAALRLALWPVILSATLVVSWTLLSRL